MTTTASTNAWAARVRANKTGGRLARAIRDSRNDGTLTSLADPRGFAAYALLDVANGVLGVAHKDCDDVWGSGDAAIDDGYRQGVDHVRVGGATGERRRFERQGVVQEWSKTFDESTLDGVADMLGLERVTVAPR